MGYIRFGLNTLFVCLFLNAVCPIGAIKTNAIVVDICKASDIQHIKYEIQKASERFHDEQKKLERRILASLGVLVSNISAVQQLQEEVQVQISELSFQFAEHQLVTQKDLALNQQRQSRLNCIEGFDYISGFCYKFFSGYSDKRNWLKARSLCQNLGGDLISIETREENQHILAAIINRGLGDSIGHDHGFWTSGVYHAEQGKWVWSATGKDIAFTNWAPGEPNSGRRQFCIQMWKGRDYQWDNVNCQTLDLLPICEADPVTGSD